VYTRAGPETVQGGKLKKQLADVGAKFQILKIQGEDILKKTCEFEWGD